MCSKVARQISDAVLSTYSTKDEDGEYLLRF